MTTETTYNHFIIEVKNQIVHSRYLAARLVNREQLLLYFIIGKRLSEKVASEKWGTKVIEQIALFYYNVPHKAGKTILLNLSLARAIFSGKSVLPSKRARDSSLIKTIFGSFAIFFSMVFMVLIFY
jgi:hypothetical protein